MQGDSFLRVDPAGTITLSTNVDQFQADASNLPDVTLTLLFKPAPRRSAEQQYVHHRAAAQSREKPAMKRGSAQAIRGTTSLVALITITTLSFHRGSFIMRITNRSREGYQSASWIEASQVGGIRRGGGAGGNPPRPAAHEYAADRLLDRLDRDGRDRHSVSLPTGHDDPGRRLTLKLTGAQP